MLKGNNTKIFEIVFRKLFTNNFHKRIVTQKFYMNSKLVYGISLYLAYICVLEISTYVFRLLEKLFTEQRETIIANMFTFLARGSNFANYSLIYKRISCFFMYNFNFFAIN